MTFRYVVLKETRDYYKRRLVLVLPKVRMTWPPEVGQR